MKTFERLVLAFLFFGVIGFLYYQDKRTEKLEKSIDSIQKDVKEIKAQIVYERETGVRLTKSERECLAKNIYQEAGVEPYLGKIGVGHVTMNRLNSARWGMDICKVVYARSQFSWTLFKKKKYEVPKGPLWEESLKAADEVAKGARVSTICHDTLWYHTDYVNPKWARKDKKVDQIGRHIFYNGVKT